MMRKRRLGTLLVVIYLATVIYVYAHDLYTYLYLLTFPLSSALASIADYYQVHTDTFNRSNIIISAICNASIVYLICTAVGRSDD